MEGRAILTPRFLGISNERSHPTTGPRSCRIGMVRCRRPTPPPLRWPMTSPSRQAPARRRLPSVLSRRRHRRSSCLCRRLPSPRNAKPIGPTRRPSGRRRRQRRPRRGPSSLFRLSPAVSSTRPTWPDLAPRRWRRPRQRSRRRHAPAPPPRRAAPPIRRPAFDPRVGLPARGARGGSGSMLKPQPRVPRRARPPWTGAAAPSPSRSNSGRSRPRPTAPSCAQDAAARAVSSCVDPEQTARERGGVGTGGPSVLPRLRLSPPNSKPL